MTEDAPPGIIASLPRCLRKLARWATIVRTVPVSALSALLDFPAPRRLHPPLLAARGPLPVLSLLIAPLAPLATIARTPTLSIFTSALKELIRPGMLPRVQCALRGTTAHIRRLNSRCCAQTGITLVEVGAAAPLAPLDFPASQTAQALSPAHPDSTLRLEQ